MKQIGIIDYGAGNITNVIRALNLVSNNYKIKRIKTPKEVKESYKIILPGVGAFGSAMSNLKERELDTAILEVAKSGRYILGICLGMQLLFDRSYEFGLHLGLGLIKGEVIRFDNAHTHLKIPHIGWNKNFKKLDNTIMSDILPEFFLYFIHSYHALCEEKNILATCQHILEFPSIVCHENIYGIQPHPERSGDFGFKFLQNFVQL